MRLIGQRFGPDHRKQPMYAGPRLDIYESMEPVLTRFDRPNRLRRYYFDSATGLLASTRHTEANGSHAVQVETRIVSWFSVQGSAYPTRIELYEDGRLVFAVVTKSASANPAVDIGTLRLP